MLYVPFIPTLCLIQLNLIHVAVIRLKLAKNYNIGAFIYQHQISLQNCRSLYVAKLAHWNTKKEDCIQNCLSFKWKSSKILPKILKFKIFSSSNPGQYPPNYRYTKRSFSKNVTIFAHPNTTPEPESGVTQHNNTVSYNMLWYY